MAHTRTLRLKATRCTTAYAGPGATVVFMIKKFITNLLAKATGSSSTDGRPSLGKRVDVPAKTHGIDPTLVDERAANVVRTLQDAGFVAYVVGGAVRDLLLGLRPKDFDVATDATPEQVKSLFRRAFIIGRRFRIVHVVYGRGREHEVIEVSTFRAYLDNAAAEQVAGNEKTSKSELAGMKHAYSTGLEFTGEETRISGYTVSPNTNPTCTVAKGSLGGQCTSLSNPTPDDAWTGSAKRNYLGTNTKATSRAAYVFDTIELDPKWLLNVGLRYDTFDTVANTNAAAGRYSYRAGCLS